MTQYLFFIGKGGVGKSTLAATTALHLAKRHNVYLLSLDPAHNQSDIFQKRLSEKKTRLAKRLWCSEIDEQQLVRKYLRDTENHLKASYSYQTAFNLEKYFNIIQYSPGIEEQALLTAFKNAVKKHTDKDYIVFDMPPTALTLKFFRLPSLSLIWTQKLLELRKTILAKKKIITAVRFGKKTTERDKVLNKLTELIEEYTELHSIFCCKKRTRIFTLTNQDKLSLAEEKRIHAQLCGIDISVHGKVINKYTQHEGNPGGTGETITIPRSPQPLTGIEVLHDFIDTHSGHFKALTDLLNNKEQEQ